MTLRSILLLSLVAALGAACGPGASEQPAPPEPTDTAATSEWEALVLREEVIHALGPSLRALGRSFGNLTLPDPAARAHFATVVVAQDVDPALPPAVPLGAGIRRTDLGAAAPGPPLAPAQLSLFEPLFQRLAWVEHASFKVVEGRFVDEAQRRFVTPVLLGASARSAAGGVLALSGHLELTWERGADAAPTAPGAWRIAEWRLHDLTVLEAPAPLFREVLDDALPDPAQRERARTSLHERLAAARLADPDGFEPPHPHFFVGSQDRHPGVAVTDVNGDGLDDVYVMARWGANQLFVNRGDGTFVEAAADWGLDLEDHSAAALFADFDNDGDPDAFVGRTLAASVYLENTGDRFQARDVGVPLPSLVSSLAAADVDGDGLLDLYVSTYAAQMLVAEMLRQARLEKELGYAPPPGLLTDHLSPGDAARLKAETRAPGAHEFLSLPGPPNVLLRNAGGGRFEPVDDDAARPFRNTYQATFADYDRDGDPDLYLAHDFSPNQLLRNEGGRFRDATEETGTADIGFGMGVAWGDYDRDGREDLYVSNMFSKAGRRITKGLAGSDPRFAKMARGNTLFRNAGSRFEVVSGLEPPALLVEKAGWSWGGQFFDADNDGFLDLYALSGYYTAPNDVESLVDI